MDKTAVAAGAFLMAVLITLGTVSAAPPVMAAPAGATEAQVLKPAAWTASEQQIIDVFNGINAFRKSEGLPALRIGVNASAVAQEWSRHMADTGLLVHSTSYHKDLRVSGYSSASENIAYNSPADAPLLVTQWINSPGHNDNMSRREDNVIGIGLSTDGRERLWGSTTFYTYRTVPEATYATAEEFLAATALPPVPAETPAILGTAAYGQTLGLKEARWPAGTQLTYQWYAELWKIPGATEATLRVNYAPGTNIWVGVTATAPGYRTTTVFSAATPVIPRPTSVEIFEEPTIAGIRAWGETLTVAPGKWTDGATLTYLWSTGETGPTHVIQDFETNTSVTVTGSASGMSPKSIDLAIDIPAPQLAYTVKPSIKDVTAIVGKPIVPDSGSWNANPVLKYTWLRDGMEISGAEGATSYTPVPEDIGAAISFSVQASARGYNPLTVVSNPTVQVVAAPAETVKNLVKPAISGAAVQGQTLTVEPGTWSDKASLSYQWLSDGKAIEGATGKSLKLTAFHTGTRISAKVTGSRTGFTSASVTTAPTANVTIRSVAYQSGPVITGTPTVGETLTAAPGTWDKGVQFTYQWNRGGKAITGATSSRYKLDIGDSGSTITVTVTGSAPDYASTAVTSSPTAIVRGSTTPVTAPFKDVPVDMQFSEEIRWMAAEGISTGWDDGTYRPLNPVARDAMSAFMYRLADEPSFAAPNVSPFADVPVNRQFFKEMSWLADQGISTGWTEANGTRTYRALEPVKRDAMAAFMYRLAGSPAYTAPAISPFADVTTGQQFYKEMAWLADQGISTGWTEANGTRTYRALEPVKRDAMAAFMFRFDQKEYKVSGAR
ncbi:CAP domain-containing protein [Arthrobacter sp. zg-Y238]|uniref:CAP domain-containing protein n=1 Tax=Arthrobacter sp. zg-Y238 TaxID=2964614 RepID=UPI002105872E|nr:CAP domain-containing protein [Arthrobacter sp. zg-Y238]MCQ1953949.1 S-layer homology domain-containing protein [Arthrobacter sp. zg-Y238]